VDQQIPSGWLRLSVHGACVDWIRVVAIGLALVLGVLVRMASVFALIYMITLLFSSNFPGHGAPLWEYFGASLDHSVLALCFATFIVAGSIDVFSVKKYFGKRSRGLHKSETGNSTE